MRAVVPQQMWAAIVEKLEELEHRRRSGPLPVWSQLFGGLGHQRRSRPPRRRAPPSAGRWNRDNPHVSIFLKSPSRSIIAMLALVVMDVAVQAVDQFRQVFRARIASSTPDNPLTPILTGGGILLTAVGVAGGLLLDANGLLGNVLANLVLIGPALVLSNFLVAYVTRSRLDRRASMQLAMLGILLTACIEAANTYLATLGSTTDAWNLTFALLTARSTYWASSRL